MENKVIEQEVKRALVNDGKCPGTDNPMDIVKAIEAAIGHEVYRWERKENYREQGYRNLFINGMVMYY